MARRGSALILVLFVMVVLGLTALSFAYRAGLEHRSATQAAIEARLGAQAHSAVAIALARIAESGSEFHHRAETWHAHRHLGDELWLESWEGATDYDTRYYVIDEEAKLHVLAASSEALETLGLTAEQIDSLFDWNDEQDSRRAEGADTSYYLQRTNAHRAKNAPVELLEELLTIRGFARDDYYGRDGGAWRFEHLGPGVDAEELEQAFGLVDLLTTYGDGRVNINTAPRRVLEVLPISPTAVDQIVGFRRFDGQSGGTIDEHVFKSFEELEQLQGLNDADLLALETLARFHSDHFRVIVQARHVPTRALYEIECVVRRGDDGIEVVQWQ